MIPIKKYLFFGGILLFLVPLGIIIPHFFHSGSAWGEWSVEQVRQETGIIPQGMKKDADLYKAPAQNYALGKESDSIVVQSEHYLLSAIIGVSFILLLTFLFSKLFVKFRK